MTTQNTENQMKKTLTLLTLAAVAAAHAQNIGVTVDGQPVNFMGSEPVMRENSVLVPMRAIFEKLGADLKWNQARQQVTANKDGKIIRLVIGERFADVDGKAVQLTTPAINDRGTTLVPLRFVSEALGARVRWQPANQMVVVRTLDEDGRAQPIRDRNMDGRVVDRDDRAPANRDAIATLYRATVIPVKLDTDLSSNESRRGDTFTASLDSTNGVYGNLPGGTKIEGRVVTATKKNGDDPGMLEVSFDRLIMPDGRTQELSGTLVSLEDKDIKTDADGRIVATGKAKDNRGVYAGIGAGAGVLLGVLSGDNTKGNVTKGLLGGLLGLGAGELEKNKAKGVRDVKLEKGSKFGVRLDEDLTLYRN